MEAGFGLTGTQGSASCCFGSLGNMVLISSWVFPSIYCEEILCKHSDWTRVNHVTPSTKTPSQLIWVQIYCSFCSEARKEETREIITACLFFPTMHRQMTTKIRVLLVWGTQNIIMQSISHLWIGFIPCLWRNGTEALGTTMLTWHFAIASIAGSFVLGNPMRSTQSESPSLSCCLWTCVMWGLSLLSKLDVSAETVYGISCRTFFF